MFKSYPALKICRLATDSRYRGEGIGAMLVNMIIASYRKDSKAGCRFITVDAYSDALDFYFKQGFAPLSKADEGADTRLLYFDLESLCVADEVQKEQPRYLEPISNRGTEMKGRKTIGRDALRRVR